MQSRMKFRWVLIGAIVTIGATLIQPRVALASVGCNLEYREVCVVLDGGEICMPWPGGECEPIIIELHGRKTAAEQ